MAKKQKTRFSLENKGIFGDDKMAKGIKPKRRGVVDFAIDNLVGSNSTQVQQQLRDARVVKQTKGNAEKKFAAMQTKMGNSFTTGMENSSPKNRIGAIRDNHALILKWSSITNIGIGIFIVRSS